MCGIAGFWHPNAKYNRLDVATKMHMQIAHRGPDDHGVQTIQDMGLTLIHRRLSIQDLSPAGHQPMQSLSERYTIVFNGEIYNHLELRELINKKVGLFNWQGHSDTETLLAAFEVWGIEQTLSKLVGMFAIALYDAKENILTLIRDRVGEKPLYYGWQDGVFIFASELSAIKTHPVFNAKVDRNVLSLYLRHNAVPSPYSIYEGIAKLEPGTFISLNLHTSVNQLKIVEPTKYWSFESVALNSLSNPYLGSESEAVEELNQLLIKSVRDQMLSDVPLGAFLSGGIDSTAVVSIMQSQSERPVKTFTIGFDDKGFNEAHHASDISKFLGTEHTEWYIKPRDALDVIPDLSKIWSEPFADSSQIPTLLVSQLAKEHVTVSLSGDAGDELFAGYNRHKQLPILWQRLGTKPAFLKWALAKFLAAPGADNWDRVFKILSPILPKSMQHKMPGYKIEKLASILKTQSKSALYKNTVSHFLDPSDIVLNSSEPVSQLDKLHSVECQDFMHWVMLLDSVTYLPDDILTKVDRAAMSVGLEGRVPFLDHRVIEFAWRLPSDYKMQSSGKVILKKVLDKYVPRQMMDRPKQGFGLPLGEWLRNDLRDWSYSLMDSQKMVEQGFFNVPKVYKLFEEHQSGKANNQFKLWDILMFQAWLEAQ